MKLGKLEFDDVRLISLEEAKEITQDIVKPFNGVVLVIVPRAPSLAKNIEGRAGLQIGKDIRAHIQKEIDNKGYLVISFCESIKTNPRLAGLKEGDYIFLDTSQPIVTKVILKDYNDNEYIAILAHDYGIVCTTKTPDYSLIKEKSQNV